jgi:oligosaccharyltransferase complex subunit epsilon
MAPKTQKATVPPTAKTPATTTSDSKSIIRSNKGNIKSTSVRSPQAQLEALNRSLTALRTAYVQTTPIRIKLIDVFLAFFVVIGVLLMGYRIVVTSYPFNGFLAAFGGAVGQFVLLAGLRSQVAPGRDEEYGEQVSPER